jgi:hypothetical protein
MKASSDALSKNAILTSVDFGGYVPGWCLSMILIGAHLIHRRLASRLQTARGEPIELDWTDFVNFPRRGLRPPDHLASLCKLATTRLISR